jgi:hypothetical protein
VLCNYSQHTSLGPYYFTAIFDWSRITPKEGGYLPPFLLLPSWVIKQELLPLDSGCDSFTTHFLTLYKGDSSLWRFEEETEQRWTDFVLSFEANLPELDLFPSLVLQEVIPLPMLGRLMARNVFNLGKWKEIRICVTNHNLSWLWTSSYFSILTWGLGTQLSGRALAQHVEGTWIWSLESKWMNIHFECF